VLCVSCSTAFQRFALYTNDLYKEGVKAAEPMMKEHMNKATEFSKAFHQNLNKELEQAFKEAQKKRVDSPGQTKRQ
jgi:hypothetical protein